MRDKVDLHTLIRKSSIVLAVCALTACGPRPVAEEPAEKNAEQSVKTPEQVAPAPAVDLYQAKWRVSDGIDVPSNIYFDSESGTVFVSVADAFSYLDTPYVRAADRKDRKGRIAKLNTEGKVLEPSWVTGLHMPSGLCRNRGTLWVSDLDEVVGLDMAKASIASRVRISSANLNDAACAPDGTVYVSDTVASKIYAVKGGEVSVFTDALRYPAGLLVDKGSLIVGASAYESGQMDMPGRLFALDLETKRQTVIAHDLAVSIGRLESDGNGGYIAMDHLSGSIMTVSAGGEIKTIRQYEHWARGEARRSAPADIAYLPATHTLITSYLGEQRKTFAPLDEQPAEGVSFYITSEWPYEKIAAYDISKDVR